VFREKSATVLSNNDNKYNDTVTANSNRTVGECFRSTGLSDCPLTRDVVSYVPAQCRWRGCGLVTCLIARVDGKAALLPARCPCGAHTSLVASLDESRERSSSSSSSNKAKRAVASVVDAVEFAASASAWVAARATAAANTPQWSVSDGASSLPLLYSVASSLKKLEAKDNKVKIFRQERLWSAENSIWPVFFKWLIFGTKFCIVEEKFKKEKKTKTFFSTSLLLIILFGFICY